MLNKFFTLIILSPFFSFCQKDSSCKYVGVKFGGNFSRYSISNFESRKKGVIGEEFDLAFDYLSKNPVSKTHEFFRTHSFGIEKIKEIEKEKYQIQDVILGGISYHYFQKSYRKDVLDGSVSKYYENKYYSIVLGYGKIISKKYKNFSVGSGVIASVQQTFLPLMLITGQKNEEYLDLISKSNSIMFFKEAYSIRYKSKNTLYLNAQVPLRITYHTKGKINFLIEKSYGVVFEQVWGGASYAWLSPSKLTFGILYKFSK